LIGHPVTKGLAGDEVAEDAALMAPKTSETSQSAALAALIKSVGTILITVFVFGIVIWWLAVVLSRIGSAPTVNSSGAVIVDQYERAKDILLVVFPLATAAVGYWFGNQGRARAQEQAQQAQSKMIAVLGTSADGELLKKAAATFPAAFPELSHPGLSDSTTRTKP
jgi:heme/copper-type cytochrome/quinol oxidase subunit 2